MGENATLKRILRVSTGHFIRHGYHGLSMREIAEGVGVSKPALYYHFKDKESLFVAVLEHHLEIFSGLVQEASKAPDAPSRLNALLQGFFTASLETRQIIRLSTQEIAHIGQREREAFLQRYLNDFLEPLADLFQRAIAEGEIRPLPANLLTRLFLGLVFPLLTDLSQENPADLVLSVFWQGVQAQPPNKGAPKSS